MAYRVRKQVYIEPEQESWLKGQVQETGLSEAELIRRAIDQQARIGRPFPPNRSLWEEELAFIDQLIAQGPLPGKRTWTRGDLYAE